MMKATAALSLLTVLLFCTPVSAALFFDDFEDGNADGWAASASGTGTTGVVDNNGSLRAYASTSYRGARSLSRTFGYVDSDILSFEMQVAANSGIELTIGGARTRHASGGAKITFLNVFNGAVADPVYLTHRTDGSMPPAYAGVFLGETLNSFSAPMQNYAALAGLGSASGVAKISLEFFANSGGGGGGTGSSVAAASVWFDNVSIATVPIPASVWLVTPVLGWIGWHRRNQL